MLKRFKTFKVLDRLSLKPLLSYSSKLFPLIRLSDLTSIGITATPNASYYFHLSILTTIDKFLKIPVTFYFS